MIRRSRSVQCDPHDAVCHCGHARDDHENLGGLNGGFGRCLLCAESAPDEAYECDFFEAADDPDGA